MASSGPGGRFYPSSKYHHAYVALLESVGGSESKSLSPSAPVAELEKAATAMAEVGKLLDDVSSLSRSDMRALWKEAAAAESIPARRFVLALRLIALAQAGDEASLHRLDDMSVREMEGLAPPAFDSADRTNLVAKANGRAARERSRRGDGPDDPFFSDEESDPELGRQGVVQPDHHRSADRSGFDGCKESVRQTDVAVVEGNGHKKAI